MENNQDLKQNIINKVLKLLELGNEEKNTNANEREVAQRKAAQLMADYSLSFIDLQTGKPKNDAFKRVDVEGVEERRVLWEIKLANSISIVFDCKVVSLDDHFPWEISFLGTKTDIDISIFFFKYLRRTVGIKSERVSDRIREQHSYAEGMVQTISQRLNELYAKREEFIPSDSKALMVIKKDSLSKFVHSEFGNLCKIKAKTVLDHHYYDGLEEGKKINLSRPISHDEKQTTSGYIGG